MGADHRTGTDVTTPPPTPPTGGPAWGGPPSGGGDDLRNGLDGETRTWCAAAHLSALLASFVLFAFLGPLLVFALGKDRHPAIAHHAREALNFNLTLFLAGTVTVVLSFVVIVATLGIGALVIIPIAVVVFAVVGLIWLVLLIIATVKAWDGAPYRYPLTFRFVR